MKINSKPSFLVGLMSFLLFCNLNAFAQHCTKTDKCRINVKNNSSYTLNILGTGIDHCVSNSGLISPVNASGGVIDWYIWVQDSSACKSDKITLTAQYVTAGETQATCVITANLKKIYDGHAWGYILESSTLKCDSPLSASGGNNTFTISGTASQNK